MLRFSNHLNSTAIIDFGLADFWNQEGDYLFVRCGTPGYVAPEVLHDLKYGFKVDVYSLGLILYLILTGDEPFSAPTY